MNKLLRSILYLLGNIILFPIAFLIALYCHGMNRQFVRIPDRRIGHLAANSELFLRRIANHLVRSDVHYIGIISTNPANHFLLEMIRRKLKLVALPTWLVEQPLFALLCEPPSILSRWKLYTRLPFNSNEYKEFSDIPPQLSFTRDEKARGEKFLHEISVDSWYVCFHARTADYLQSVTSKDTSHHEFRNCDINNYRKAMEYITEQGGYALRIGHVPGTTLNVENKKIIDYGSKHRDEFADIYLPSRCRFYVGCGAGIDMVARIFDIPIAEVNRIPLAYPPYRKGDLFIPKKVWSEKLQRLLSFRELVVTGAYAFLHSQQYKDAGLRAIENTSEEIVQIVQEMYQRINNTWKKTEEDERLQKQFRSIFSHTEICYGFPSRIGTDFLRKNKDLLA